MTAIEAHAGSGSEANAVITNFNTLGNADQQAVSTFCAPCEARAEVAAHPFDPPSTAEVERRLRRRSQVRGAGLGIVALLALGVGAGMRWRLRRTAPRTPPRRRLEAWRARP